MNNENEHSFDNCIENPPFAEAVKTLVDSQLTEGQAGFFVSKQRILDEINPATENEQKLKKLAQFLLNQFKNLQIAENARKEYQEKEIQQLRITAGSKNHDLSKALNVMCACYRAIDRNFGDYVRERLKKNDETERQGKIRKITAELERLTRG